MRAPPSYYISAKSCNAFGSLPGGVFSFRPKQCAPSRPYFYVTPCGGCTSISPLFVTSWIDTAHNAQRAFIWMEYASRLLSAHRTDEAINGGKTSGTGTPVAVFIIAKSIQQHGMPSSHFSVLKKVRFFHCQAEKDCAEENKTQYFQQHDRSTYQHRPLNATATFR